MILALTTVIYKDGSLYLCLVIANGNLALASETLLLFLKIDVTFIVN